MPYKIVKDGEQHCIEKEDTGERVQGSCHDTEKDAMDQMQAIYAHEKKEADEEGLIQRIIERIQNLGKSDEKALGFKVVGDQWIAVWSNNFKDRDGEIFTAKAHDAYVKRVDMGLVPKPQLWGWHIPGSKVGVADWVDRHGHFMLAGGHFDKTPEAQIAKAYLEKHGKNLGVSHGYQYPESQYDGKHYHAYNTVEISPLPGGKEANFLTAIPLEGVKSMKEMTPEKKQFLIDFVGQERADRILKNLEDGGKAYEELGLEFKDFAETEESSEAKATKEAVAKAEKAFGELIEGLVEGQNEVIDIAQQAVKGWQAEKTAREAQDGKIADLEKTVKDIQAELALKPRSASTDPLTTLDPNSEQGKKIYAEVESQMVERDSFWGTTVVRKP